MIVPTLPNLNLSMAKIFKANAGLICKLGEIANATAWTNVAPTLKNGNTFLVDRGTVNSDVIIREGSIIHPGTDAEMALVGDNTISSIITPGGARSSGTNFFFSEDPFYGESLSLLANKYNHIYPIRVSGDAKFGVIATDSPTAPDSLLPDIINDVAQQSAATNPRQAFCRVDATGEVISLLTFPRMVADFASIPPSAGPSFVNWKKGTETHNTNALTTVFEFLAGTGTGTVGEIGIFAGPELVAYKAIDPQILKDSDVDLTVTWNMMVGDPEVFI